MGYWPLIALASMRDVAVDEAAGSPRSGPSCRRSWRARDPMSTVLRSRLFWLAVAYCNVSARSTSHRCPDVAGCGTASAPCRQRSRRLLKRLGEVHVPRHVAGRVGDGDIARQQALTLRAQRPGACAVEVERVGQAVEHVGAGRGGVSADCESRRGLHWAEERPVCPPFRRLGRSPCRGTVSRGVIALACLAAASVSPRPPPPSPRVRPGAELESRRATSRSEAATSAGARIEVLVGDARPAPAAGATARVEPYVPAGTRL